MKYIKKFINFLFKIFPIKKNKILFECGRGMVDGSPKAIFDYMKLNDKKYRLIWIVSRDTDVSQLEKKDYCYSHTLRSFYERATSKYWIKSESIDSIIKKRKKQIFIQVWHGHGAVKKMEYDINNEVATEPLEHVKNWDYLLTNDPLDEKTLLSSTGYQKKTCMIGTPLLDSIICKSKDLRFKEEVLRKIGVDNDKKIIFYAPTFRDDELNEDKLEVKIQSLKSLKDYVVLVRLHPLIRDKIDKKIFDNDTFINVCSYPDATDLLCISDILISDYSSIIYEYSILERPIIFYAYDLEKYQKSRGFYIKYPEDLPGKVVYDETELYEAIDSIEKDSDLYLKKLQEFNRKYNYLNDGEVCKRFYEMLESNYFDGKE